MSRAYRAMTPALLRAAYRDPLTLGMTFILPVVLLIFFSSQLGASGSDNPVNQYFPGVIAFGTCFVGAYNSAIDIAVWRTNGMMQVLRNSPVSSSWIVLGAMTVTTVVALLQFLVLIATGCLPIVGADLASTWPLAFLPLLAGNLLFFAFGWILGAVVRSVQAVGALTGMLISGMGFCSGAFIPPEYMPRWAVGLIDWMPLHYVDEPMSWLLTGVGSAASMWQGIGVTVGTTAVLFVIVSRIVRFD